MARTKNRFNAMVVPETVSADMPVTIVDLSGWHFMPDYPWS